MDSNFLSRLVNMEIFEGMVGCIIITAIEELLYILSYIHTHLIVSRISE